MIDIIPIGFMNQNNQYDQTVNGYYQDNVMISGNPDDFRFCSTCKKTLPYGHFNIKRNGKANKICVNCSVKKAQYYDSTVRIKVAKRSNERKRKYIPRGTLRREENFCKKREIENY